MRGLFTKPNGLAIDDTDHAVLRALSSGASNGDLEKVLNCNTRKVSTKLTILYLSLGVSGKDARSRAIGWYMQRRLD